MENQLDHLDREMLEVLSQQARIPFTQLADRLKISNSLVHQRVNKLKDMGVLGEAGFHLSPRKLGYATSAYVLIMLQSGHFRLPMVESLQAIPEVVEVANIAGRYDLMAKVYTRDNRHLRDILYEQIQELPGVEGTNTIIAFETAFQRGVSPWSKE
ncbi:MAG: Lrp/AsnC family transcriptional regulator [Bacteroidota bacterium]